MADIVQYYDTSNITAFPSSNSVDNGKLTIEENMRNIVTRITTKSYVLNVGDFFITLVGNTLSISKGEANLHGYDITVNTSMILPPPSTLTGTGIIVGMKLTYDGSNHIRGDVVNGSTDLFEGLWVGYFPTGTVDIDMLTLGTIDYDGTTISNIVINPDITNRFDGGDIKVVVQGPKPPHLITDLQNYIDLTPNWYVSKYGDIICGDGIDDGTLSFYKYKSDTDYKLQITAGTSDTSDGGTIIAKSTDGGGGGTDVHLESTRLGFSGFKSMVINPTETSTTSLGNFTPTLPNFKIENVCTGSTSGSASIEFNVGVLDISSDGKYIQSSASTGNAADNLTHVINPKNVTLKSTSNLGGHVFGYDSTGASPYYTLGDTTMTCVNHVTSIVSGAGGSPDILIKPNMTTGRATAQLELICGNSASVGTDILPGSLKQRNTSTTLINGFDTTNGIYSIKNIGVSNSSTSPFINSSIYTNLSSTSMVLNNPTGTSSIYFNGSSGNNVSLNHASNSNVLNLTGNLTVSADIHASRVFNAVYNDYAEFMEKRDSFEEFEAGDVIEVDSKTGLYQKTTTEASSRVVGVCSDNYGHIMGGEDFANVKDNDKKYIAVGLSGRIPVKIDCIAQAGDLLISSKKEGIATVCNNPKPGTVIGKALERAKSGSVLMLIMNM